MRTLALLLAIAVLGALGGALYWFLRHRRRPATVPLGGRPIAGGGRLLYVGNDLEAAKAVWNGERRAFQLVPGRYSIVCDGAALEFYRDGALHSRRPATKGPPA